MASEPHRRFTDDVLAYHERTKHRPGRFARSLGYLDWDAQPDPFLRYQGAPLIRLDRLERDEGPGYDDVMHGRWPAPAPLQRAMLSTLLRDSLALSAWKVAGANRWALRVNPSSGNLHPTEGYVLAGPVDGLTEEAGLYHYAPLEHALELRARIPMETWNELSVALPANAFFVGLTSIVLRESWKYGERAFRYCQHDVGHAIGALSMAAAMLGWRCHLVETMADDALAWLLGIAGDEGPERQVPACLTALVPAVAEARGPVLRVNDSIATSFARVSLQGSPTELSPSHQPWPLIDEVEMSTRRRVAAEAKDWRPPDGQHTDVSHSPRDARTIVRQRRSAVALDGSTHIERDAFYRIARRMLPSTNHPMLSALPWRPSVHLAFFVHRVRGLEPGLYVLVRDALDADALRDATDGDFVWSAPPDRPADLALWLMQPADVRDLSRGICCHQAIASDGAFALGMLARFHGTLDPIGPWFYRRLFWECGVLGQILYLEAEALGVRGTGIGCFFDDAMHEVMGMTDTAYQSLYHFTVGGPVEDPRLQTEPAYGSGGGGPGA